LGFNCKELNKEVEESKENKSSSFSDVGGLDLVIIDYGAGNIQSIKFAIQRLGFEAVLTSDVNQILAADKVIFPGVGEASSAMAKLKVSGLDNLIPKLKQPVLGICLGMQLMCNSSEEGNTKGLGIFDVDVVKFSNQVKVPQIGWNQITNLKSHLFEGISETEFIYMVHSFYAPLSENTVAISDYGIPYSAALQKNNFYGTQFHPEKSSVVGERILLNFLKLEIRN
jgi:glutamine amidotransferase